MRIDGKVVLITGASEGIGAACAREFAASGAKLSLTARNEEGLHRAAGSDGLITAADITNREDSAAAWWSAPSNTSAPSISSSTTPASASISPPGTRPWRKPRYLMELNFFAPLAMTQLVVPAHARPPLRHAGQRRLHRRQGGAPLDDPL